MADQQNPQGKICPQCGAVSPYSEDFCNICGARLPQETVCQTCGEHIPSGELFCGSCGASAPPSAPPPPVMNVPPYTPPPVAPQNAPVFEPQPGGGVPVPGKGPKKFLVPAIIAVVIIGVIAAVVLVGIPGMSKPVINTTNTPIPGTPTPGAPATSRAFEGDWQVESAANTESVELFRITILPDNTVTASFPGSGTRIFTGTLSDGGSTLKGTYDDSASGESGTFTLVLSDNYHFTGSSQFRGHSYTMTGQKGTQVSHPVTTSGSRSTVSRSPTISATQTTAAPVSAIRAGFSTDKASGAIPLTVSFRDTSTGSPGQWYWDFGDGTYSTEQNPVHTFKTEGSFTVVLNADKNGQTSTKSQVISASSLPLTANFVADTTSGNAPLPVTFTDTSTGSPSTWIWQFGNGQVSYDRNPEITYQGPGAYTVQLTVEKGGVQSKKSMTINVNPAPSVVNPVTVVVPITAATPVTLEFNNGNIYTVYNSPTKPTVVTFATPVKIISVTDYHWNNGNGASPGSISLKHSDGTVYGSWSASGEPGQGGVPNANWIVKPSVNVKAGTYTVIDSSISTWSQNSQSGNAGMTHIVYQPV